MRRLYIIALAGIAFCGASFAETVSEEPAPVEEAAGLEVGEDEGWKTLVHGMRYRDLDAGDGKQPGLWAAVYVHYRLIAENGTVLEDTFASETHGRRARKHVIGSGTMPEALELAIGSMRERGRRSLMIPADLFSVSDFHTHNDEEEHDGEEHNRLVSALKPGTNVAAEVSLLWVRPYDPSNFNRFR